MNDLALRAMNRAADKPAPPIGASDVRVEEGPQSRTSSLLQGLGLPAIAILLAAHPIGRKIMASMARIAPKEAATLESSRIPFFVNAVPEEQLRRGLGGYVRPGYRPSVSELDELARHPRAPQIRQNDPFLTVALPEQAEGAIKIGPAKGQAKTVGIHEMQHAAGAAKEMEKESASGVDPSIGGFLRGALHDELIRQPSVGQELVKPAVKDFPDLPYMYSLYRADKRDPRFALGELLNEYIARVKSGIPRDQNMMFGPYGGNAPIFEMQKRRFMPELEDIMSGAQPQSDMFSDRRAMPNLQAWEMLQRALMSQRPR